MTTLAMNNHFGSEINELKASSLLQRIKALEENGLNDTLIKKRVPSYAAAAPLNDTPFNKGSFKSYHSGNSTKIYQNPNNHEVNLANTSMNSVSSAHSTNSEDTFNESPDIVREDRIASPVNYHHIIDELNDAKSRLRKVPEPAVGLGFKSPVVFEALAPAPDPAAFRAEINSSINKRQAPVQPLDTPTNTSDGNTSFSKATSKLLAETLKKVNQQINQKAALTENNDSTSSLNQIPISIPLSGGSEPHAVPSRSRSSSSRSSAAGINALIGIWNEVDKHNKLQASRNASKSLGNISANNPAFANVNNTSSNIRSDHSYSKHSSPKPYTNPQAAISSLKSIVSAVHSHTKLQTAANNSTTASASDPHSQDPSDPILNRLHAIVLGSIPPHRVATEDSTTAPRISVGDIMTSSVYNNYSKLRQTPDAVSEKPTKNLSHTTVFKAIPDEESATTPKHSLSKEITANKFHTIVFNAAPPKPDTEESLLGSFVIPSPVQTHKSSLTNELVRSQMGSLPSDPDKPYVSPYAARASPLSKTSAHSYSSAANETLSTAPVRASSCEQLDSDNYVFDSNVTMDTAQTASGSRKSLYEDYLSSNHQTYVHTSSNRSNSNLSNHTVTSSSTVKSTKRGNRSSSILSNNTITSNRIDNHMNAYGPSYDSDDAQNNNRSHLVSCVLFRATKIIIIVISINQMG